MDLLQLLYMEAHAPHTPMEAFLELRKPHTPFSWSWRVTPFELVWCVWFTQKRPTERVEAMASQVVWLSWLRREIVTFEIRGSNPLTAVFLRMM